MHRQSDDSTPPRHVILIQADDLGYDDLGANGNQIVRTPNLDRLAEQSVRCRDFVVNPVCAPSRATLLTGRHFLRTGVSHVHGGKDFLHRDERTLGDAFRAAGWKTGMWGKWHSGHTEGYFPWQRGFDEAFMAQLYRHRHCFGRLNGEEQRYDAWADEVIFDQAIDFLTEHREEPSFLYIPTMTPHTPLEAPEEQVSYYREQGLSEALATLYGMITYLDMQVGRLLDYLDEAGLADDTLLMFMSDNGPAVNIGILSEEDRATRNVNHRRGWKGDIWENGVRAPLFVRWPRRLKPREIEQPVDQVDLFPTILEWCGLERPQDGLPLDGEEISDVFEGESGGSDQPRPIFNYSHPGWITSQRPYTPEGLKGEYNPLTAEERAGLSTLDQPISVREGPLKLLLNPFPPEENAAPEWFLSDLAGDPEEAADHSAEHPEAFERLRTELTQWFDAMKAEPRAFTAPLLEVPAEGATQIPGKVPCWCSNTLQNTVGFLGGWKQQGQAAEYSINVSQPGRYRVALQWVGENVPTGATFQVSSGNSSSQVEVTGSEADGTGELHLEAGRQRLRVELKGEGQAQGKLLAIHLSPQA